MLQCDNKHCNKQTTKNNTSPAVAGDVTFIDW